MSLMTSRVKSESPGNSSTNVPKSLIVENPSEESSSNIKSVYSRVVLRHIIDGLIWAVAEREEVPEDLVLCLEQMSSLWKICVATAPFSALEQLKISGPIMEIIESPFKDSLQNSILYSYAMLLECAYDWLKVGGPEGPKNEEISRHLAGVLRDRAGDTNTAIYSRVMESCYCQISSSVPTLVNLCVSLSKGDEKSPTVSDIDIRDHMSYLLFKFIFNRVAKLPEGCVELEKTVFEEKNSPLQYLNVFSWLSVKHRSQWPWLLLCLGFNQMPEKAMVLFLDEALVLTGDSKMLQILLRAAAISWQGTKFSSKNYSGFIKLRGTVAVKSIQVFFQWCLSR